MKKPENSYLNAAPSPLGFTKPVDKLCRLQPELVSEALRRAVDDASAAMAHQLSEPLTALLFVLQKSNKQRRSPTAPKSARYRCVRTSIWRYAR